MARLGVRSRLAAFVEVARRSRHRVAIDATLDHKPGRGRRVRHHGEVHSERSRNGGVDRIPLPDGAGGLWLCGKHFIGPDVEAALDRIGGTTVVCLSEAVELVDRYPEYVEWLRAHRGSRAIWHPIPDLHAPDATTVSELLAELRDRLDGGEVLLVHCGAGIGRAGTLAAALLISMGTPLEDAIATVAAHRPMAGPEAGAQRQLLEALAAV